MFTWKNSIGLRLLRYVFGCYLVVAVIVTVTQLIFEYQHVKSNVFDQLYDLEKTFKDSLVTSLWSFDTTQLEATLMGMKKIEIVSGVKIENEETGFISSIGDFMSKEVEVVSSEKTERQGITKMSIIPADGTNRQTLFEYRFPIEFLEDQNSPAVPLGYGHIYANEDTIIDRVKYSFVLIIINSVIKTAALWLFFLFFVNRLVGRPLNTLTSAAIALNPDKLETLASSEDLDAVIQSKHDDELYLLAKNFNQMRQAILEKISIIESQKNTLEKRVAERTESLTEANEELKHLALHDTLTSLPNRNLFQDRLELMLKFAQRNRTRFAVASIDLAKFKAINDSYGHQIGDLLLAEVAARMSKALRTSDTLARIGGDEFSALFPVMHVEDAEVIARHILKALDEPFVFEEFDGIKLFASANIGTAIYPEHGEDGETLIKNADMAMYQAKHSGVSYGCYCEEEDSILRRQLKLSQDIAPAIEDNQFFLVYQPIFEFEADRVTKLEALIRWQHPTLGLLSPMEFIPLSERNGTIMALSKWVLKTACKQCREYCQSDYPVAISINISGRIFNQAELPGLLEDICIESQVSPSSINLEITETTAMGKPDQAIDIINQLNDRGFTVSIDDFGAGYSSFSYLTMLPVKELKLDKSFLLNMGEKSDKVIKSMLDLAHSLNLKVVAEGVENKEVLDMLKEMKCDFAQGFYIAKPLPIEAVALSLEAGGYAQSLSV